MDTERVLLDRAHIVSRTTGERDRLMEQAWSGLQAGHDLRGVGPAYEDKMARIGLRLGDLLDGDYLDEYLPSWPKSNRGAWRGRWGADEAAELRCASVGPSALRHRIVDSYPLVRDALRRGDAVILEGQLGAGRDIDWGIYPYVTSSAATAAAGAARPASLRRGGGDRRGEGLRHLGGRGPLVTEQFDQTAEAAHGRWR